MEYNDYDLDEIIQGLIDEVPEGKLKEELDYRLHRLIETEDSFIESQEAVLESIRTIDSRYYEGDLTVDAYYGIMDSVRKAEI